MFWALTEDRVDTRGFEFEHVLKDIQTLNEWALEGRLEVTAISLHSYPHVQDRYVLLPHGASMGSGCGPIVVAPNALTQEQLREVEIAVPGKMTTAFLVLRLVLGDFRYREVPFDEILDEVQSGRAAAGLLIHEGQLTYGDAGLEKCVDLGEWWWPRDGSAVAARRECRPAGHRRGAAARPLGCAARLDPGRARQPARGHVVRDALRPRARRGARRPLRRHVRQRLSATTARRSASLYELLSAPSGWVSTSTLSASSSSSSGSRRRPRGGSNSRRALRRRALGRAPGRSRRARDRLRSSSARVSSRRDRRRLFRRRESGGRGQPERCPHGGASRRAARVGRGRDGEPALRLGLSAVVSACHAVVAGDGDLFVAGGVESMSRAPLGWQARPRLPARRPDRLGHDARLALPQPANGGDVPARVDGRDRRERRRAVRRQP